MRRVAIYCGLILIVVLICSPVIATDNQAVQYYNEGLNYYNHGQYTEALASYDKALAINPNLAVAKQSRDNILNQQTQSTPLLYAPIGAIVLIAGIAVWGRRRAPQ